MNANIPAEVALKKFLEPDDPMQVHRAETLDCLSLSQLNKHLAGKVDLADEQLEHIARCAEFCQMNQSYLRKHGGYRVQLSEKVKQEVLKRWEAVRDSLHLPRPLPETIYSTQTEKFSHEAFPHKVLIEESTFEGKFRVTRGCIQDGRFIARLTFELPQKLRRPRLIQLLFIGTGGEVFNALDLPGLENQLINIQLPDKLEDKELDSNDPPPFELVLRLGDS